MKTITLSLAWALAAAAAMPLAAHAQEINLTKPFGVCMDKADGVTQSMVECIDAEIKRQDARLNKAYKALLADLNPERKKQLLAAQRAWLKFRDANCGFYFDPEGGTIARVLAVDCLMTMTASRATELENFNLP
jgi:uncharacterized protein YecT (DUF1311 family)